MVPGVLLLPEIASSTAAAAGTAGVPAGLVAVGLAGALGAGVWLGVQLESTGLRGGDGRARWPRDWPGRRDIFSTDDTRYHSLGPGDPLNDAMFIGRTYPRFSPIPDVWPLRELRFRVEGWFSSPVAVPYHKRFEHVAIYGGTGAGKTTGLIIPMLALGAFEQRTSYFAIDVKSPEFLGYFGRLYREHGKDVILVDPWTRAQTMAMEPLWRADRETRNVLAAAINSYSLGPKAASSSGNEQFFEMQASSLLGGLLGLAQYWPRRFCNLPCVQRLVKAGEKAIREAIERAPALHPEWVVLEAAVRRFLAVREEEARAVDRAVDLTEAIAVLDRAGFEIQSLVRARWAAEEAARRGAVAGAGGASGGEEAAFWEELRALHAERGRLLTVLIQERGAFLTTAEVTRGGIVSGLENKLDWFGDPDMARVFSREEVHIGRIVRQPCLFIVGAPLAKKEAGAIFLASLCTKLVVNEIQARQMRGLKPDDPGVFIAADEFPQLNITAAPDLLATLRGQKGGMVTVSQERGQTEQAYDRNATTMEGNQKTMLLFRGAHPSTAKFFSEEVLGRVRVRKRTRNRTPGQRASVTISEEEVPRASTEDVRYGILNGKERPGLAWQVGSITRPFPMKPVQFFEDPHIRKIMRLRRSLDRTHHGRPTWQFWRWRWRWKEGPLEPLVRREETREPAPGDPRFAALEGDALRSALDAARARAAETRARAADPFTQTLDFLFASPRRWDPLVVPTLLFSEIGVTCMPDGAGAPAPMHPAAAPPPAGSAAWPPQGAGEILLPRYSLDFQTLAAEDFQLHKTLDLLPAPGGALAARAAHRAVDAGQMCYRPGVPAGIVEDLPDGGEAQTVTAAQFYTGLLGISTNPFFMLTDLGCTIPVPDAEVGEVEAAILAAYRGVYGECLTPPCLLQLLRDAAAAPGGPVLLERLEQARLDLWRAESLDEAVSVHAQYRVQFLVLGASGAIDDRATSIGEFLVDHLLTQWGAAGDVRAAEEMRGPGESLGDTMRRMNHSQSTLYERATHEVHVLNRAAELVPASQREAIEAFSIRRTPYWEEGLLSEMQKPWW